MLRRFLNAPMLILACTVWDGAVHAVPLLWMNASGGSTSVPGNWNPAQVPTGADQLFFALNNTYAVTFSSTPASLMLSYSAGTVSANMGTHNTQNLLIADNPNNIAVVNIAPANLTASLLRIADESTTTGTLNVSGFATDLQFGAAIVGNSGDATLNVTLGAEFASGSLVVGSSLGSDGIVNVNEVPSFPALSPKLNVGAGVIGGTGTGELHVTDGGDATFATLVIAAQSNSSGLVTVAGPDSSTLNVTSQLNIGRNETTAAAGSGTLIVNDNATVTVNGTTFMGDGNGGFGTLRLDGNGTFKTNSLFASPVVGILDLREGQLIIDGGVFNPPGFSMVIDSPLVAIPTIELRNGATFDNESVGLIDIGDGELYLTSNSFIDITQGATVGTSAGEFGILRVDDGASLAVANLGVGGAGEGMAIVNQNGTITTPMVAVGFGAPSAFGTLDVINPGALVDADHLFVGGNAVQPNGTGIVTIADGGVIQSDLAGGVNAVVVYSPGGTVHVLKGGTLDVAASISVNGLLNLIDGDVIADNLSITGDLEGFGTVNADVTIQSGGVITPGGGGLLDVGDSTDNAGFNGNLGQLTIGDGSIRIRDANGASLGNTTIFGGTLDLFNGGTLLANRTLSGNGTVEGDLINLGTITNSGSLGLRFLDGTLTSENRVINGNRITFGLEGGFEGFGTIACAVIGEAGSEIIATGNLTMGNALDPAGVSLSGTLNVGPHNVTFQDLASGVPLGTMTKINGGTLENGLTLFLGSGDILSGAGTIDAPLSNNGIIRPGAIEGIGTLNVLHTYTTGNTGDLEIEFSSLANVDRVACSLSAALDGDLIVKPINGFIPSIGQEFIVLTASAITGSFDNVSLAFAPPSLGAEATITSTQVKVKIIANPCPADAAPPGGGNNVVDVDDLLAVINAWGPCLGCAADVTNNGTVDVDDLLGVVNAWGACP